MDKEDFERFEANRKWFNAFFKDIHQLFARIGKRQSEVFEAHNPEYFYPKKKFYPTIPRYCMIGQRTDNYSLQLYAVFDVRQIKLKEHLDQEASFVIVRHSRPDRHLYTDSYGWAIIRNNNITAENLDGSVFRGNLPNGSEYQAFQLPFRIFKPGVDMDEVINTKIIDVLKSLPEFSK